MIKLYHFDELRPEEILNRDIRAEKNVEDVVDGIIADVRARGGWPPNSSASQRAITHPWGGTSISSS